jgi:hypothetical protein
MLLRSLGEVAASGLGESVLGLGGGDIEPGSGLARGRVAQTPRVRAGGDRLEGAAQRRRTHPRVVGQRVGGEPVAPFEVVVQRRGRGEVMGFGWARFW